MKHSPTTKLLSLLLAIVLLMGCSPFAYASELGMEGETEPLAAVTEATQAMELSEAVEESEPLEIPETTQAVQETEAVEETEAVQVTEPAQVTLPAETTPETVPETTEPTESTEPTETTESTEPTETTETTEPGDLPWGLKGLPEDYVLSDSEKAARQEMVDHDVAGNTAQLTAGKDYEEGILILTAESEEQARLYAEAYSAELVDYSWGIAEIRLTTATVSQAMAAAQDLSLPLPPASPNHITTLDPIPVTGSISLQAPSEQSWNTWINENMTNPDPALKYPASTNYQYMHDVVDSYAAWGVNTGNGWGKTVVAVLDTGVRENHPDLTGKVRSLSVGLGTSDENGHGTHVAGIIAASMNNGSGGAGIAPNAEILNIRVATASGSVQWSTLARAIRLAADEGASVINMSLGFSDYNTAGHQAVNYALNKGVVVVASMGNDGSNYYAYPAAFDGVISVIATDRSNERASYSNYGAWADIAAPGDAIYSCDKNGGYTMKSGTSMAAPVVSGIIALYMNTYRNENLSPAAIKDRLKSTATRGGMSLGAVGIANAAKMLSIKPRTPGFRIYSKKDNALLISSNSYTNQVIPCESRLSFTTYDGDQNWYLLYTTDGKMPSVLNGQVVNGTRVQGYLDLEPYAGQTLNLKVMQVNGMGMCSLVLSKSIKVAASNQITGVRVTGPTELIAGGTGEFKAVVEPEEKANQTVGWYIDYAKTTMYGAKIDFKTGKLTTPRLGYGEVYVYAVTVNNIKSALHKVVVSSMPPVAKMTMNPARQSIHVGASATLSIHAVDSYGNPIDPEVRWTSNNPKIATVDDTGKVTAVSKGSAIITCKALDGSNRSAMCMVTVTQPVEEITVTGQLSIAPGSFAIYKTNVLPMTANNRLVSWVLSDNAPFGVTVSTTGMVSVPSYVQLGKRFWVFALAKDGSGTYGAVQIEIANKCSGIFAKDASSCGLAPGVTRRDRNGYITALELFNVDLPNTSGVENQITLTAMSIGTAAYCQWSSSNPAIAEVTSEGTVTAHKAGNVTLSCVALDGSNKRTTISLKVSVPTSTISISTNALKRSRSVYYLAFGKSAINKVVFSDTYGKPTNQKVAWDFSAKAINSDGSLGGDLTNVIKMYNYVTLTNGMLMVNSTVRNLWGSIAGEIQLTVTAKALDGTGATASINYVLIPPATKMYIKPGYTRVSAASNKLYHVDFFCDQRFPFNLDKQQDFIITSSNPKVASAYDVRSASNNNNGWYHLDFSTGVTRGTAVITIKTVDGSNKFCSFTVTVR